MTVILASNNNHKRRELSAILVDHTILLPSDLGISFVFHEAGATFMDNALGKARALFALLPEKPAERPPGVVISDDSGLCVDALGGAPGIRSARYGSPDGGATELRADARNTKLLAALDGVTHRGAHFVCCMVALFSPDRFAVVQETFHGEIAAAPSGGNGFGYDPIFLLPNRGRTVAELPEAEKNTISHRARAARATAATLAAMDRNGA